MKMMAREAEENLEVANQASLIIRAMRSDHQLFHDDLQAGRNVSAVLIGVVTAGLLGMILTVLLSLKF